MGKKETGWVKRYTQIVSGWRERMRSVSAPQAVIITPADGATSPYEPLLTVRDKKRAHSHFPPLHQFPCYILKSLAFLIHAAGQCDCLPACLLACLPFLKAPTQSCHRESRLYKSLLFSPNLSAAERLELALLQIYRPLLACLCLEKKSLLIVTTDNMPTHAPHQSNMARRFWPSWLDSDPTQLCLYLLRCLSGIPPAFVK